MIPIRLKQKLMKKRDYHIRCVPGKVAPGPTSHGVCAVKGRDGPGGWDSCVAVEDEDSGGGESLGYSILYYTVGGLRSTGGMNTGLYTG